MCEEAPVQPQDALEVRQPGMLTVVQDRGRWGYQQYGIPVSGAMDEWSLVLANRLAGNPSCAAALELTVVGPRLRALRELTIALAGANLSPTVNGEPIPMWESLQLKTGDDLAFGECLSGCRAYLAVQGGVATEKVFGSRSTDLRTGLGGVDGRPLQQGTVLQRYSSPPSFVHRRLANRYRPDYRPPFQLRIVRGPQFDDFTEAAVRALVRRPYSVTAESDRMGLRLQGPKLTFTGTELLSEGIPPGTVQVPSDGQPIILGAERQSTGGYPKPAVVITPDLGLAGQLKPGDKLGFNLVDHDAARRLTARFLRGLHGSRSH